MLAPEKEADVQYGPGIEFYIIESGFLCHAFNTSVAVWVAQINKLNFMQYVPDIEFLYREPNLDYIFVQLFVHILDQSIKQEC